MLRQNNVRAFDALGFWQNFGTNPSRTGKIFGDTVMSLWVISRHRLVNLMSAFGDIGELRSRPSGLPFLLFLALSPHSGRNAMASSA